MAYGEGVLEANASIMGYGAGAKVSVRDTTGQMVDARAHKERRHRTWIMDMGAGSVRSVGGGVCSH